MAQNFSLVSSSKKTKSRWVLPNKPIFAFAEEINEESTFYRFVRVFSNDYPETAIFIHETEIFDIDILQKLSDKFLGTLENLDDYEYSGTILFCFVRHLPEFTSIVYVETLIKHNQNPMLNLGGNELKKMVLAAIQKYKNKALNVSIFEAFDIPGKAIILQQNHGPYGNQIQKLAQIFS